MNQRNVREPTNADPKKALQKSKTTLKQLGEPKSEESLAFRLSHRVQTLREKFEAKERNRSIAKAKLKMIREFAKSGKSAS